MSIADNIAAIRARIARAAEHAGREASAITLMAVSKTFPAQAIREAYEAGGRVFGENRVQEFAEKVAALGDLATSPSALREPARFHLIGHLQSNKVGKAAEIFHAIDSLDSLRLAEKLNAASQQLGRTLDALIEINIGGEAQKSGLAPDSAELDELLAAAPQLRNLRIRGLMAVPPWTDDSEPSRPFFRALRELRDRIAQRHLPAVELDVLSMGMSHDFEVAIEEGATCVRVGTAIFGKRTKA